MMISLDYHQGPDVFALQFLLIIRGICEKTVSLRSFFLKMGIKPLTPNVVEIFYQATFAARNRLLCIL